MSVSNIREIDLKLISDEIICRAALNQQKAVEYGILMAAGTIFPPIDVFEKGDGSYIIGDGRTRYHGAGLEMRKTIACNVHPKASPKEILAFAFKANSGGSCQVDFSDARHTIMKLIEWKASRAFIEAEMPYPRDVIRRLYLDAYRNIVNKKCLAALSAMTKNPKMSMEDAARIYDIKIDELVAYSKRGQTKGQKAAATQMLQTIHQRCKAFTAFQANTLKICMQRYQSSEMSADETHRILTAFDEETGKHRKNLINWQNRFAKIDGPFADNVAKGSYPVIKTEAGYVMQPKS